MRSSCHTRSVVLCMCLFFGVMVTPRPAQAGGINLDGLSELLTTGAGLLALGGVLSVSTAISSGIGTTVLVSEQEVQAMHLYLNAQQHTAYMALYSADPSDTGIRDLAHLMNIPVAHHNRFAALLFESRATLALYLPLQERVSPSQSRLFTVHLVELLLADEFLGQARSSTQALSSRHASPSTP